MKTQPKDRSDLINWIDGFDEGIIAKDAAVFYGVSLAHMSDILRKLRKNGAISFVGPVPLSRWCTARNHKTTIAWRERVRAEAAERERQRNKTKKRTGPRKPPQISFSDDAWAPAHLWTKASECTIKIKGPRWIFDLGAHV